MPKKKSTKIYKLWSPSIVGSIYFDNDGNWWVYRESKGKLVGLSANVKGKEAKVVPRSFSLKYNRLKAVV
jgi:hypothetical protein